MKTTSFSSNLIYIFFLSLIFLVSCSQESSLQTPPLVEQFTGSTLDVKEGDSVTLSWRIKNADQVLLNGRDVSKTTSFTFAATSKTTTYNLIAKNSAGEAKKTLAVVVGKVPTIKTFDASTYQASIGESINLSWQIETSEGTSTSIDQAIGNVTDKDSINIVINETKTFTLTSTNKYGSSSKKITVEAIEDNYKGLTINSFEANYNKVTRGTSIELTWDVMSDSSIDKLILTDGINTFDVRAQKNYTLVPLETTTYTLSAYSGLQKVVRALTVTVGVAPLIKKFETSELSVLAGSTVTLSWQLENTTSISISPEIGTVTGDYVTIPVTNSQTYTLSATNEFGTSTAILNVAVNAIPVIHQFDSSLSTATKGRKVNLIWNVMNADTIRITPDIGLVNLVGSSTVTLNTTQTYTLTASKGNSSVQSIVTIKVAEPITFLIAGQSNAVGYGELFPSRETPIPEVRMLGNDYQWKQAQEPLDDPSNQIDTISQDSGAGHSFGLSLGKSIFYATNQPVYLIPSARGATSSTEWLPSSNPLDRNSLFGSAAYRGNFSENEEGGAISAIIWYQGESDNSAPGTYMTNTKTIVQSFQREFSAPVIYAQLATRLEDETSNERYQVLREQQRLMETGFGSTEASLSQFYMVVTHDLPMRDVNHLTGEGQRILGERIALTYRENVLNETINGTGPRLANLSYANGTVTVSLTKEINDSSNYENYFSVFINGINAPISSLKRDPLNAKNILLFLSTQTNQGASISVRYMPPADRAFNQRLFNIVKDNDGLPLPAFGPLVIQ